MVMNIQKDVLGLLDGVLVLKGRTANFDASTPLLGDVPELNSMAVMNLVAAIEEHFDITFEDEAISGETFASVGSLTRFIQDCLA
jgi:acyl carrier protein